MDLFTKWGRTETQRLCMHVLDSHKGEPQEWAAPSRQLRCSQAVCALRWNAVYIRNCQRCKPSGVQWYTAWELSVLLLGSEHCQSMQMKRKDIYAVLAGWLPGRSPEGVKQALAAHVAGNEAAILHGMKHLQLPQELLPLLDAWVHLPIQQKRQALVCPSWDPKAAAASILAELKSEQQLEEQQKSQQQELQKQRLRRYVRAGSPSGSQSSDIMTYPASSSSLLTGSSDASAAAGGSHPSSRSSDGSAAAGVKKSARKRQLEQQASNKMPRHKKASKRPSTSQHSMERSTSSNISDCSTSFIDSSAAAAATVGRIAVPAAMTAGGTTSTTVSTAAAAAAAAAVDYMQPHLTPPADATSSAALSLQAAPLKHMEHNGSRSPLAAMSTAALQQNPAMINTIDVAWGCELFDCLFDVCDSSSCEASKTTSQHAAAADYFSVPVLPQQKQQQQAVPLLAKMPCDMFPALVQQQQQQENSGTLDFALTLERLVHECLQQQQQHGCCNVFSDEETLQFLEQLEEQQQQQEIAVAAPSSSNHVGSPGSGCDTSASTGKHFTAVQSKPALLQAPLPPVLQQQQQRDEALVHGSLLADQQPWWVDVEQAAASALYQEALAWDLREDVLMLPSLIDLLAT